MYSSLGARRRIKTHRRRGLVGAIVALLLGLIASPFVYLLAWGYDIPFRVAGRFEKEHGREDTGFSLSAVGKSIVYSSTATGHGDLWVMDLEGHNSKQLTTAPEYEAEPCFSPNGRQIVFSRETGKCGHIWLMNSDGTGARQVTAGPDYDVSPTFSPDGRRILFQRVQRGLKPKVSTFTLSAHGYDLRPYNASVPDVDEPAFTPDGQWVYFIRTTDNILNSAVIWRMRPDGADQQSLQQGRNPTVSPDGKKVAFVPGGAWNEIWIMDADGSRPHLVYRSESEKESLAFAPDGRSLVFSEAWGDNSIARVNLDGSGYHRLKP